MVDAAVVSGIFKDADTTIKLLTEKYLHDKSLKKAHTAMPAKITGLQHYTLKTQNQGQQNQSQPGPSNQVVRTQKNTQKQKQPANAGAQTDEQKKQKRKAVNKVRKDKKKVKRAALAALQAEVDAEDAEDADVILIDSMGEMALTAADVPSLNQQKIIHSLNG